MAAATKSDPWISDNALYGHYDYYFYLNAAILFVAFLIYVPVSRAYVERPIAPPSERGSDDGSDDEEEDESEADKLAHQKEQRRLKFEDHARAHLDAEDNAVIAIEKH